MNPLINLIGRAAGGGTGAKINPQMIAAAKRMINMLNTAANPADAVESAAKQNPMLGSVLGIIGNKDPKTVFYELCRQNGVNPEEIINMLK